MNSIEIHPKRSAFKLIVETLEENKDEIQLFFYKSGSADASYDCKFEKGKTAIETYDELKKVEENLETAKLCAINDNLIIIKENFDDEAKKILGINIQKMDLQEFLSTVIAIPIMLFRNSLEIDSKED